MKFKPSEKKADSREQSGRDAQSLAQSACRFAGGSRTVYFGPEQAKHLPEAREAQLALLANEPEGSALSNPDFIGGEHKVPPDLIAIPEVQLVTFYRQRDGILITDAHPRNFRLTPAGLIVPIDLVVSAIPTGASRILAGPGTTWSADG